MFFLSVFDIDSLHFGNYFEDMVIFWYTFLFRLNFPNAIHVNPKTHISTYFSDDSLTSEMEWLFDLFHHQLFYLMVSLSNGSEGGFLFLCGGGEGGFPFLGGSLKVVSLSLVVRWFLSFFGGGEGGIYGFSNLNLSTYMIQ
jgi:hypothetical protein